jgi:hypothetical protein
MAAATADVRQEERATWGGFFTLRGIPAILLLHRR